MAAFLCKTSTPVHARPGRLPLPRRPPWASWASPAGAGPILGISLPVGQVEHHRGTAATFRLTIGQMELEGRWLCVGREFIRLGDDTEELRPIGRAC